MTELLRPDAMTAFRLHVERTKQGYTQRGLVDGISGLSYAYISRIESGQRTPSWAALVALAEKLDTTAIYLGTGEHRACPFCSNGQ